MKETLAKAMKEAEMDEIMVFTRAIVYYPIDLADPLVTAAIDAQNRADRIGSAMAMCKARAACAAWMDANEEIVLKICAEQKAKRDAYKASLNAPMTPEQVDKMLGM